MGSRSVSQDSVYTILIRLPPDGGSGDERAPSIKMIQDDIPLPLAHPSRRALSHKTGKIVTYIVECLKFDLKFI